MPLPPPGGIGSGQKWKENGPGGCCCGLVICGCTGLPNVLHLTVPTTLATVTGVSVWNLTWNAGTSQYVSPAVVAGGSTYQFFFSCNSTPNWLLVGKQNITTEIGSFVGPASPCGSTFLWSHTYGGAAPWAGLYTLTN